MYLRKNNKVNFKNVGLRVILKGKGLHILMANLTYKTLLSERFAAKFIKIEREIRELLSFKD